MRSRTAGIATRGMPARPNRPRANPARSGPSANPRLPPTTKYQIVRPRSPSGAARLTVESAIGWKAACITPARAASRIRTGNEVVTPKRPIATPPTSIASASGTLRPFASASQPKTGWTRDEVVLYAVRSSPASRYRETALADEDRDDGRNHGRVHIDREVTEGEPDDLPRDALHTTRLRMRTHSTGISTVAFR